MGLPFPSPGSPLNPEIQGVSPAFVGSRVRHYRQNGGMVPSPLSSFCRHGSPDEELRPCNSDLSFPLLGWVDWKGILRCLLFLRGAWEDTKPSAVVLKKIIHKVNHWHLFKDFYKRVFQDEHIGRSSRPWERLLSEAYLRNGKGVYWI